MVRTKNYILRKWPLKLVQSGWRKLLRIKSSTYVFWQEHVNLSQAPWYGSQLTLSELEEVLLGVEINLNNRPLTYIEDDLQFPILTPNNTILRKDVRLLNELPEEEIGNWKKLYKYVTRCKDNTWKRWNHEYLVQLRERHNYKYKEKQRKIQVDDKVMIKGEDKNKGKW